MVSKIGGIESDPLSLKSINFDKINEKRLKPYEDRVKTIQDKIDLTIGKGEAFGILKTKLKALKASIGSISLQTHEKIASVTRSTEVASIGSSADDYFDVSASSGAYIGDIDVRVQQLATKASAALQKTSNTGFAIGEQFKNDALSINMVGVNPIMNPIVVDNLYNLTINQVVDKINRELNVSKAKASATLVPTVDGLYNIKITSAITGNRTITLQPQNLGLPPVFNNDNTLYDTVNNPNSTGLDAIVIINDLQVVNSHSNTVKLGKDVNGLDIPNHFAQGITLILKKENATLNPLPLNTIQPYQTISIEQDKNIFVDKISDFIEAYNDIQEFITEQEARKAHGFDYEDTSYLARTTELRTVKSLLYSINNHRIAGTPGEITSLASMDILHKAETKLLEIRGDRLKNLVDTDFDGIMNFFNHAENGLVYTFTIKAEGERKTDEKCLPAIQELIRSIEEAAIDITNKISKEGREFEKANKILSKEQQKIKDETAQLDFISMQASLMQMYFQAMMQA